MSWYRYYANMAINHLTNCLHQGYWIVFAFITRAEKQQLCNPGCGSFCFSTKERDLYRELLKPALPFYIRPDQVLPLHSQLHSAAMWFFQIARTILSGLVKITLASQSATGSLRPRIRSATRQTVPGDNQRCLHRDFQEAEQSCWWPRAVSARQTASRKPGCARFQGICIHT